MCMHVCLYAGKWTCAHRIAHSNVTYDLYSLPLNGTRQPSLFDKLDDMYTADRVQEVGTKVWVPCVPPNRFLTDFIVSP